MIVHQTNKPKQTQPHQKAHSQTTNHKQDPEGKNTREKTGDGIRRHT